MLVYTCSPIPTDDRRTINHFLLSSRLKVPTRCSVFAFTHRGKLFFLSTCIYIYIIIQRCFQANFSPYVIMMRQEQCSSTFHSSIRIHISVHGISISHMTDKQTAAAAGQFSMCCVWHEFNTHVTFKLMMLGVRTAHVILTCCEVRLWATSSVCVGMSMPYTLANRTGGAAEAKYTLTGAT